MRRTLTITLSLFAALALAPAALAQKPHRYSSSFELNTLSTGNGYPSQGGVAVLSGDWNISGLGESSGALLDRVTITGHPTDTIFTFKGAETGFLPGGTINNVATGWSLLRPDGTLAVAGEGDFIGGTGKYRGARGHFTYTGTGSPVTGVTRMTSRGTIAF
jgi:hypothetical protein